MTRPLAALLAFIGSLSFVTGAASSDVPCIDYGQSTHWAGGFPTARPNSVVVANGLTYVADEQGLIIMDTSDPACPESLGTAIPDSTWVDAAAIVGTVAYVLSGEGLTIFDVSNPANPIRRGSVGTPGYPHRVAVAGTRAFIAAYVDTLTIVDVADLDSPTVLATMSMPVGFEGVNSVVVDGSRVLVGTTEGLRIYDGTSSPPLPMLGWLPLPGAYDLYLRAPGVWVSGHDQGLFAVSVADPSSPVLVGSYLTDTDVNQVGFIDDLACVAADDGGLRFVDVTDPAAMIEVGNIPTVGEADYVAVSDSQALIACYPPGSLQIVDVGSLAPIDEVGSSSVSNYALAVAREGDHLYVGDGFAGLTIFDISSPTLPVELASIAVGGVAEGVAVSDGIAFVAAGDAGLVLVDATDPADPVWLGAVDAPGFDDYGWGVAVQRPYAYLAADFAGLLVIDVSDSTNPTIVSGVDTNSAAYDVALSGSLALVADAGDGLVLVDISQPLFPTLRDSADTPGVAWDVVAAGPYAYVADTVAGLTVMDIQNPDSIFVRGSTNAGAGYGISLHRQMVYVANADSGMSIVDISNPDCPRVIGLANTSGVVTDVIASDDIIVLADGPSGIRIYPVQCQSDAVGVPEFHPTWSTPLSVSPAQPNPFLDQTTIHWQSGRSGAFEATVYDVRRRLVRVLDRGVIDAGHHEIRWSGEDTTGAGAAPGVYFVRVRTTNGSATRKVVRLAR